MFSSSEHSSHGDLEEVNDTTSLQNLLQEMDQLVIVEEDPSADPWPDQLITLQVIYPNELKVLHEREIEITLESKKGKELLMKDINKVTEDLDTNRRHLEYYQRAYNRIEKKYLKLREEEQPSPWGKTRNPESNKFKELEQKYSAWRDKRWAYSNEMNIQMNKIDSYKVTIQELELKLKDLRQKFQIKYLLQLRLRIPSRYPKLKPIATLYQAGKLSGPEFRKLQHKIDQSVTQISEETYTITNLIQDCLAHYDRILNKILEKKVIPVEDPNESKKYELVACPKSFSEIYNPSYFIGDVNQLIKDISDEVEVVNVENVLRPDLINRFKGYRKHLQQKYIQGHQRTTSTLANIEVAYHGTYANNMYSIVKNGLVVPVEKNRYGVQVAHGSRYGTGIYVSPQINFSLHYSRGEGRLLIVAVLPGKKHVCHGNKWSYNLTTGYDSHVSPCGKELVLFKAVQVLPCMVIHYLNTEEIHQAKKRQNKEKASTLPETAKEKRHRLKREAMKQLPYGFGPAGSKFVVEEIGEYSDQEDYEIYMNGLQNQYQEAREIYEKNYEAEYEKQLY